MLRASSSKSPQLVCETGMFCMLHLECPELRRSFLCHASILHSSLVIVTVLLPSLCYKKHATPSCVFCAALCPPQSPSQDWAPLQEPLYRLQIRPNKSKLSRHRSSAQNVCCRCLVLPIFVVFLGRHLHFGLLATFLHSSHLSPHTFSFSSPIVNYSSSLFFSVLATQSAWPHPPVRLRIWRCVQHACPLLVLRHRLLTLDLHRGASSDSNPWHFWAVTFLLHWRAAISSSDHTSLASALAVPDHPCCCSNICRTACKFCCCS